MQEKLTEKHKYSHRVLDVCCGGRMFWLDKSDHRAIFIDRRKETHLLKDATVKGGVRKFSVWPDIQADFTRLPFQSNYFGLVVFDPPHRVTNGTKSWMHKKYGTLQGDWQEMLKQGFSECFRVLAPGGTLIFKWSEYHIQLSCILALTDSNPLFGHRSGKQNNTHWITFMKDLLDAERGLTTDAPESGGVQIAPQEIERTTDV